MSYQLRLNGKTWKSINGKPIRHLIYNGTVYEITQPTKWPGYLTFSSEEDFSLTITEYADYDGVLEYSTDGINWLNVIKESAIQSVNNKIYLRGIRNAYCRNSSEGKNRALVLTGKNIKCEGNIESLLDYNATLKGIHPVMYPDCYEALFCLNTNLITAPALPATELTISCYFRMFEGCTSLATAPVLPATSLAMQCYGSMFYGCTNLTTAPELPATQLAHSCYNHMFAGCTSLTQAPGLPATVLDTGCYAAMFRECTSLTIAPELPATTLATECYQSMFSQCDSLTIPPILPATTLARACYQLMFSGCTSLTIAPILPVATLAQSCYAQMFQDCTNLTTAPALPVTTLADKCYRLMFYGCRSLKFSKTKTSTYVNEYRIPSGTATGTATTDALDSMFLQTGGSFTGTPSINTTYYTSNELVYGLTIQVDDSEKDYIQILSEVPSSITTNQTIRLRVRALGSRTTVSYSNTGGTSVTREFISSAEDGSYNDYDLIISNPTDFDTIQIKHSVLANPTPW